MISGAMDTNAARLLEVEAVTADEAEEAEASKKRGAESGPLEQYAWEQSIARTITADLRKAVPRRIPLLPLLSAVASDRYEAFIAALVDAFLEILARRGWRLYRAAPVCRECQREVNARAAEFRVWADTEGKARVEASLAQMRAEAEARRKTEEDAI
jgi:hypothetical protein